jgi:hypothetical protein
MDRLVPLVPATQASSLESTLIPLVNVLSPAGVAKSFHDFPFQRAMTA